MILRKINLTYAIKKGLKKEQKIGKLCYVKLKKFYAPKSSLRKDKKIIIKES